MLTSMKSLKFCVKTLLLRKFIREFPNKNWNRCGLDHMIKIGESDSIMRKSGSDRQRTAHHDNNIDAVTDLVQSQEDRL